MNIPISILSTEDFASYSQIIKLPVNAIEPTYSGDHFSNWKQQGILNNEGDVEVGVYNLLNEF